MVCERLTAKDLENILKYSEGSLLRQYEREFEAYGIKARFEDTAIEMHLVGPQIDVYGISLGLFKSVTLPEPGGDVAQSEGYAAQLVALDRAVELRAVEDDPLRQLRQRREPGKQRKRAHGRRAEQLRKL